MLSPHSFRATLVVVFIPGMVVYYVYGFMLLVFLILLIVTLCVTIVGTYFLLNAENYHWQWTSFFSAASTAAYVYLYSIYYYSVKTKMTGFFQTSFYFGYTLMFCLGIGILCGGLIFVLEKNL
ncbi:transmembrane 9 superfamily member 1-like [Dendrobium catenatum]|uniref:transmembrane 9 superfamily member 1-like n=1 Tax=Dendrobium catenatum TaxID=906689 RepID=UPI0010A0B57B|nr:transmembrane 9 superfamily member 1-like [Dendrobium catenatum]